MSAEALALTAGTFLTLFFSYVPGLNAKFAAQSEEVKRLIMLILIGGVAVGVYGVACLGYGEPFGITVACDQAGALGLIQAFVVAAIANQSVYKRAPKTPAVQEARKEAAFEALAE